MAGNTKKIDMRRNKILQQLNREGKVTVAQLSDVLGITPVTIRNDLSVMEREGLLLRVQGGAMLPAVPVRSGLPNTARLNEKAAIAQAVAKYIHNGDTLFINSGTTTACVAEALRSKQNINVVTNSLAVATRLGDIPSIRVVLLGGEINVQYGFTYGGDAQDQLSRYQADWAILSVEGVNVKNGITTRHAEEAIIDRNMILGSNQVIIAADHSKVGYIGFAKICNHASNISLITDCKGNDELKEIGWNIICAESNTNKE